MPEVRFTVPKKLNDLIVKVSDELGVDKSDYIRGLVLVDLRKNRDKNEK